MKIEAIFLLLVIFQFKHFIADYPLQTPYMLRKFMPDWSFFWPLMQHSGVHALMTLLISFVVSKNFTLSVQLALFDLIVHFIMDRVKAGPKYLGRYKSLSASEFMEATPYQKFSNKMFWNSLGLDQMVHHITDIFIVYQLCRLVK